MNNKLFVSGAVGLALVVFTFLLFQSRQEVAPLGNPVSSSTEEITKTESESSTLFIRPHSPRFGNGMARVTVVEWLDPECEACRAMHPAFKRIIAEYGDRVHFVIRYMPYHSGSMFAASALEEAREYGVFDNALTVLFDKQPEWGDHQRPRPDLIPSYLAGLGVPIENLEKEKLISKHGDKIRQDQEDGDNVGVKGTPSFFVNQKPLRELGEAQLRAAIEQELDSVR